MAVFSLTVVAIDDGMPPQNVRIFMFVNINLHDAYIFDITPSIITSF